MRLHPPDAKPGKLRVLIADDEPAASEKLRRLLAAHADIELVGSATNGAQAVQAIASLAPDLVLLDIRMPELDGFAVLERSRPRAAAPFHTIFVTAYDEYAIRAFDVRALDYLLKPFDAARLATALARAREQLELERQGGSDAEGSSDLLAQLRPPTAEAEIDAEPAGYLERICIKSIGRTEVVRVVEIERIEAGRQLRTLHTTTEHPLGARYAEAPVVAPRSQIVLPRPSWRDRQHHEGAPHATRRCPAITSCGSTQASEFGSAAAIAPSWFDE